MKLDDSDTPRNKVPTVAKRDVPQVRPVEHVKAKYSAESGDELPQFHPEFDDSGDEQNHHRSESKIYQREDDVADIHGLDSGDITPEITHVMDNMMGEITRLRAELDVAQNRISFLEGLGDHDPVAGCLSAPAFVRHVGQVLMLDQKGGTVSSLAMVTIKDWEAIHHGMNRKADETVISHLGRLLRDDLRTGDVVGHTADDEFAIIFVASDLAEAQDFIDHIQTKIISNPPYWPSGHLHIETVWSLMSLAEYSEAADVLAEADRIMRQALKENAN